MLTIEKVVKLLDDHYYEILCSHLSSVNATFPLRLIQSINRDINTEQSSDELCQLVYDDKSERSKRKFFQLAHHTFRLTSFLSKNYPFYLLPNIKKIQGAINSGEPSTGFKLSEITLDLAKKIEDNRTTSLLLGIMSRQAHLTESYSLASQYLDELQTSLRHEQELNEIYARIARRFNAKNKPSKVADVEETLRFFDSFEESESFQVRILSRYGHCFALYFLNREEFYSESVFEFLNDIEEQIRKYNYIVFPFLEDLSFKVSYLKARYLLHKMDIPLVMEESENILEKSKEVLFWNSFKNSPELFAIAFQTSFYSTNFISAYLFGKSDQVPNTAKQRILQLKKRCEEFLESKKWNADSTLLQINIRSFYCMLGLLSDDEKEVKNAVGLMESTLVEFQQIPFHFHIDSFLASMVIGYFKLKDYKNVAGTYKRYRKLADGKAVNHENDITIHGFYYAAQWLSTQRKQYVSKFKSVLEKTDIPNLEPTNRLLQDIAKAIKLPLSISSS